MEDKYGESDGTSCANAAAGTGRSRKGYPFVPRTEGPHHPTVPRGGGGGKRRLALTEEQKKEKVVAGDHDRKFLTGNRPRRWRRRTSPGLKPRKNSLTSTYDMRRKEDRTPKKPEDRRAKCQS